jgi:ribosomal-protein-alanine N-acetyltransferase
MLAGKLQPTLRTRRLQLRPLRGDDAPAVTAMIGDKRVSRWLLSFPYPYPPGAAVTWIRRQQQAWVEGTGVTFAIVRKGELVGTVGLRLVARHDHGELGYWLGIDHWGQGYAVEAARVLVGWAMRALRLRRIYGQYLGSNHASGRVMEKVGMVREGVRRRHIRKGGRWYDAHQFGILREEVTWRTRS